VVSHEDNVAVGEAEPAAGSRWQVPFFTIWTGQAASLVGSELVQFALVWWLTKRTGSATALAIASMMGLLPQIVLSPFAGALVDRWNRRIVMAVADSAIALATLGLAALFAFDIIDVWHVYVLMFVRSLGGAFHWPAMQASTSLMVPQEQLARVAGLNQMLFGAVGIVAPPLGALMLEVASVQGVLAVDVATAVLAVSALLFVHIPQPVRRARGQGLLGVLTDMRQGWRYVWAWPGLVGLMVLALIVKVALTPAFSLLPLLVRQHYGGEAPQYSLLNVVVSVGIVTGGLILSAWGGFKRKIYTTMMGVFILGGGLLGLGLLPPDWFPVAVASGFVVGLVIPLIDGPIMAITQSHVVPEMQGRVFTLIGSLLSLTSPIGLALAGPVADRLGLGVWYLVAALLCFATGIAGTMVPAVVHIEENANGGEPTAPAAHPTGLVDLEPSQGA
jgi:DHA3 family macrolide efflux protein-like MFS transporter